MKVCQEKRLKIIPENDIVFQFSDELHTVESIDKDGNSNTLNMFHFSINRIAWFNLPIKREQSQN